MELPKTPIMHEARIILPFGTYKLDGACELLELSLGRSFGGWTRTTGKGAWFSAEQIKMVYEDVYVYDVEMPASVTSWQELRRIARNACRDAEQECVYVRWNGEVNFIGRE